MLHYNNMNKKKIIAILIVCVVVLSFIILICHKDIYTVNVELIDDFSPDRKLIVLKNDKEIEFDEIQYTDGVYLCSGVNPTVSYSEIDGIKELIIKINDKKQVTAKIVEK